LRTSILCPKCGEPVDVNEIADTAICCQCESAFRLSELADTSSPDGASFEMNSSGFRVVATTHAGWVWLLLPVLCVWIGIAWRLFSVLHLTRGFSDAGMLVFAIPFVLGFLLTCLQILMLACGRIEVTRDGDEGSIFEGIGQTGWTRRFRWSELRSVREATGLLRPRSGPPFKLIELEFTRGRRPLKFGTLLTQQRRWFLMSRLRSQIRPIPSSSRMTL
jgi:hypothetical protein